MRRRLSILFLCAAPGLLLLSAALPAGAHDAPSGWSYPYACCSDIDCRPVAAGAIGEGRDGFTIRATGELIPHGDTRLKPSPDGEFHWCSVAGAATGRTLCLFVPVRGV